MCGGTRGCAPALKTKLLCIICGIFCVDEYSSNPDADAASGGGGRDGLKTAEPVPSVHELGPNNRGLRLPFMTISWKWEVASFDGHASRRWGRSSCHLRVQPIMSTLRTARKIQARAVNGGGARKGSSTNGFQRPTKGFLSNFLTFKEALLAQKDLPAQPWHS